LKIIIILIIICKNDCEYASEYNNYFKNNIDVLFIDTSHLYEHTINEIKLWFPLLNNKALFIFHDINLYNGVYKRKNSFTGTGWDNQRDVIRSIEEYFETNFNKKEFFNTTLVKNNDNWRVVHDPDCNGLTCCFKNC